MKLVARNKARRESGKSSSGGSSGKKTPKNGGVQVGLHAFFGKRTTNSEPSGPATKRQKTPPTSPEPDHSDVEVITID